jgi:hypothetical protein
VLLQVNSGQAPLGAPPKIATKLSYIIERRAIADGHLFRWNGPLQTFPN